MPGGRGRINEDGALEVVEAVLEHGDGLLTLQVLLRRRRTDAERQSLLRQRAQLLQRRTHLGHELFALCGIGTGVELGLRYPGAQALLAGRQLDEADVDVAGDAAALDLPVGDADGPQGNHSLEYGGGSKHCQCNGQTSSEHGAILCAADAAGDEVNMNAR